jgi:ComF family protein
VYDGRLRDAILRIKQPGGDGFAEVLGTLFAASRREKLLASSPQVIVPVPLHWRRWWERRHNQAEGIARGMSSVLGMPVARRAIRRVRGGPKQPAVSAEERRRNVSGAFRPQTLPGVKGLRVLLIDDVLTTGATADAAAESVRTAGAAQVHVAVLAHR